MIIGVPKEVKNHEYRVGMVPFCVKELVNNGHQVLVQHDAGIGVDCDDEAYKEVGAEIVKTPEEIFKRAEMIVKVKEPQPSECKMLRKGQLLFTYLHLAPDQRQTDMLLESGCIAIAYETVTDPRGGLPLLAPMSEVAGRLSVQVGTHHLQKEQGGRGILLGGVPGVAPANVVILGGGVVGINALEMAIGLQAEVTVLDKSLHRLRELKTVYEAKVNTVYSTRATIEEYVYKADLVVGAVLVAGAAAPHLVTKDMLPHMQKHSVIVDVAIDQGGCFETSRPTTHQEPTYIVDDVIHYCVTNMPGAVPRTSTFALNIATLPFTVALANYGYKDALLRDPHLLNGLNVYEGKLTNQAVGEAQQRDWVAPTDVL